MSNMRKLRQPSYVELSSVIAGQCQSPAQSTANRERGGQPEAGRPAGSGTADRTGGGRPGPRLARSVVTGRERGAGREWGGRLTGGGPAGRERALAGIGTGWKWAVGPGVGLAGNGRLARSP